MDETFFIDIWSDVVCPFCYLGSAQLRNALAQFEHQDLVVIRHHAFELDRSAPASSSLSLEELIARKYGVPVEQMRVSHNRLEAQALELGMTWSLDSARPSNTFDAHRLIALATTQGKGEEMNERLFRAYFSEGVLLSDHEQLDSLATEVGVEDAGVLWGTNDLVDDVRNDESRAEELGITGVPAILIDQKFMVLGAQGTDSMLATLQRAWNKRTA